MSHAMRIWTRRRLLGMAAASALIGATAVAGAAPADDELYQALGGEEGVRRLTAELVQRVYADDRISPLFKETNPKFLAEQLRKQFCELSGGPCRYDGETMAKSHATLGITKADFHALVEDLQLAMAAQDIPFRTQNRLLALLAPMHRDIVTR